MLPGWARWLQHHYDGSDQHRANVTMCLNVVGVCIGIKLSWYNSRDINENAPWTYPMNHGIGRGRGSGRKWGNLRSLSGQMMMFPRLRSVMTNLSPFMMMFPRPNTLGKMKPSAMATNSHDNNPSWSQALPILSSVGNKDRLKSAFGRWRADPKSYSTSTEHTFSLSLPIYQFTKSQRSSWATKPFQCVHIVPD